MNATPCPWLLDPSGAITLTPSRTLSHCGAEPARPELPKVVRAERCVVGGACQIRQAREAQLGALAESLAPRQPVGRAVVMCGTVLPNDPPSSLWRRALLVVVLAGVLTVSSGPIASVVGPAVTSIIGSRTASSDTTPTPSVEATPTASPSESPSPTPSPSTSPAPSGSALEPKTYVVRSGDTLYDIGLSLGMGPDGYREIAALNNIAGPAYAITTGQVLKLP